MAVSPSLPHLRISLQKIKANYLDLCSLANPAEISAVVKADAYGLGLEPIAKTLCEAGCQTFWVAYPFEAIPLREIAPDATIYVFSGVHEETLELFKNLKLRPVITTQEQFHLWQQQENTESCALHVETGLNRMALKKEYLPDVVKAWKNGGFQIALIMSHLACDGMPDHPLNALQRTRFDEIRKLFPKVPASLAASGGLVRLGEKYTYDLVRVGRALYGFSDKTKVILRTKPVFELRAPVVANMTIEDGETVGYSATWKATKKTHLSTLSVGYADGVPFDLCQKGCAYFSDESKTYQAPLVGRISMDLLTCDITDVPRTLTQTGKMAVLIDATHYINDMEAKTQTIDYQILTNLGKRFKREYV